MQFSSIPGKTSAPAATPGVSYEFSAALINWLAEARLAISHDPRMADRYWDRFEVLLLRNGALERCYDEIGVPSCGLAPWQRARITSYVDANLAKRLSTAELAALVRLSTSHFSCAFKASLGCSPHEYVIRCRIVRAKMLMLETGISLAQIAFECGLADQAHLCRLFRRRVGISPSAWRRGQQLRRVEAPEDAAITQKSAAIFKKHNEAGFSMSVTGKLSVRGGVENINANSDAVETPIQLKRHYEQSEAIQGECYANPSS
jgi:AraC family transcriptional regulator